MERVCPDAWLINYVNPANFVADAIRRRSAIRSVTICVGGGNGLKYILSEFLKVDLRSVCVRAAGINHHTWLMEFTIDGKDRYPLLKERIQSLTGSASGSAPDILRYLDFKRFCLKRYGYLPANDSYLFPYFSHSEAVERYRSGEHSLYRMFAHDLPEHWRNFEAMADGRVPVFMDSTKHHTHVGHGDIAVDIIRTMATDNAREFHINVPNEGCITNLPKGSVVEVPALVDRNGVRPLCMGELLKGVVGLTAALLNWQELSVDAALSGDVSVVVQALLAHPWILSLDIAERMAAEMLSAHAAFLPQFAARGAA
jgi:alpha-galactosidase/6-phospho-beta-glucosidase family protein